MSMLAERKRKQKWSLNPRGKAWSQDSNKFGQKLLEKMGWSQGKGLGAKEDGRIEHIKVSYKNDSQGMGYKESDDQWTEHEANYSALLAALGGGGDKQNIEIKLSSLEEKSQTSKARVHYKKFTRGKDLSRYSEKDLANIFGKKSLKQLHKAEEKQEPKEQEIKEKEDSEEKDKNFSNAGLMSDYFKKKLPNFGKTNGFVIGNNGVLKKGDDSESETEQRPSFGISFNLHETSKQNRISKKRCESESESELRPSIGFGFKQESILSEDNKVKSSFVSYMQENTEETITPKKKKDKKRRVVEATQDIDDTPSKKKKLEAQNEPKESPAKKKKDKTKKKKSEDATGLSNPAFDPMYTPIKLEKHILEPIEESIDESLTGSLNDTLGQVAESFEVQVQINNEVTPVKREEEILENVSKKKKKKKDKTTDMDMSYQNEEVHDQDASRNQSINEADKVQKKRKKKSKGSEESIQEMDIASLNSSNENSLADVSNESTKNDKKQKKLKAQTTESIVMISEGSEEQPPSSKKKKVKSKGVHEGIENPFFNISMESESSTGEVENPYEVKVKEKKKKKSDKGKENVGLENPIFTEEDSVDPQDLLNEKYEVKPKEKSKKKKKKDKEENKGLDNPALNLNDSIEEGCDLMLNVVATPVQTSQDKSVTEKAVKIKKVKGVERKKSVTFSDVTRERIIPTKEEIQSETLDESRDIVEVQGKLNDSSEMTYIDKFIEKKKAKKRNRGLENSAFDQQANIIEENISSISNKLDTYQAEIENDINEAKMKSVEIEDIMVGEVGNPDGSNEKLPDGSVKLKFKYANFKRTARYIENLTGARKSYKHLIKGDIVMEFKETNLHEIDGYAVSKTS